MHIFQILQLSRNFWHTLYIYIVTLAFHRRNFCGRNATHLTPLIIKSERRARSLPIRSRDLSYIILILSRKSYYFEHLSIVERAEEFRTWPRALRKTRLRIPSGDGARGVVEKELAEDRPRKQRRREESRDRGCRTEFWPTEKSCERHLEDARPLGNLEDCRWKKTSASAMKNFGEEQDPSGSRYCGTARIALRKNPR